MIRVPKRCPTCGKGYIKRIARSGRTYLLNGVQHCIPSEILLKECLICHEMPMTLEEVEAIEAVLKSINVILNQD